MDFCRAGLTLSTLLCSLVAGLVLAFEIVVMPGIRSLGDHDFLQAFKVMDRVIQNNQPIFVLVWLGSVVVLVISTFLGFTRLEGLDRVLLLAACSLYVVGVQLPTATINIPLNNQLQAQDLGSMSEETLSKARASFEPRWVWWNSIRTAVSILVAGLLIFLVLRL